jgi:sugar phosphate isomerase/epimerase
MNFRIAAFADEADGQLANQIEAMHRNQISLLEIRNVNGTNVADLTPAQAREIRETLDDAGIAVWSIGSPYGKTDLNGDLDGHLESFRRGLETAQILGAKHIRMFSFYVPEEQADARREEVLEHIGRMLRIAEHTDLLLCHENEKGIYGSTAARCKVLHEAFPQMKAVFDPANYVQCGQDTIEAWDLIAPYVEYMHIKDALESGFVVPAGKGAGHLPYLLSHYRGEVLTVEPHLTVFDGFEKLERGASPASSDRSADDPALRYRYPSGQAAFDAAVSALKELL